MNFLIHLKQMKHEGEKRIAQILQCKVAMVGTEVKVFPMKS